MIWVIYTYNVMFNLGTGMETVTHLKNRTLFQYGAFKCGPASEPLTHNLDALPSPWEIVGGISAIIQ